MQNHRGKLVKNALLKYNKKRINYDYFIGQKILKYDNSITGKQALKTNGPFEITCVHRNGTVNMALCPEVSERLNF